jgi:hypothetical protein
MTNRQPNSRAPFDHGAGREGHRKTVNELARIDAATSS